MTGLNSFDTAILIVLFISVLVGLMRGLIREVLSLLAWFAAFAVSIAFSSRLASVFSGPAQSAAANATSGLGVNPSQSISALAITGCFVGLFIVTLIIGSLLSRFISQVAEGQGISLANRFLGAVFGFIRGFMLVLIILFLAQFTPLAQRDGWRQSQFVLSLQPPLKWLNELVQPGLSSLKTQMGDSLKKVNPGEYIDQLKKNFDDSGASQFFQK